MSLLVTHESAQFQFGPSELRGQVAHGFAGARDGEGAVTVCQRLQAFNGAVGSSEGRGL